MLGRLALLADGSLLYVGKDKYENEDLIKWGWPEDVWFHVDNLSSPHVYVRLAPVRAAPRRLSKPVVRSRRFKPEHNWEKKIPQAITSDLFMLSNHFISFPATAVVFRRRAYKLSLLQPLLRHLRFPLLTPELASASASRVPTPSVSSISLSLLDCSV